MLYSPARYSVSQNPYLYVIIQTNYNEHNYWEHPSGEPFGEIPFIFPKCLLILLIQKTLLKWFNFPS